MKDKIIEILKQFDKLIRRNGVIVDYEPTDYTFQFYASRINVDTTEISEGAIHEVVQEMLTGLKGDDRIILEDYFRAGIAWALSKSAKGVSDE